MVTDHDLDPVQRVLLTEACRQKDRLDAIERGEAGALVGITLQAEASEPIEVSLTVPDAAELAAQRSP